MYDIEALEQEFLEKMTEAAKNSDKETMYKLASAGTLISEIKVANESLQAKYVQAKALISVTYPITFTQILTRGSVEQFYLSFRSDDTNNEIQPVRPNDGQQVEIEFPDIGKVTTVYSKKYNRFKDRKHFRTFIEENALWEGSILKIHQMSPTYFKIEIQSKF